MEFYSTLHSTFSSSLLQGLYLSVLVQIIIISFTMPDKLQINTRKLQICLNRATHYLYRTSLDLLQITTAGFLGAMKFTRIANF